MKPVLIFDFDGTIVQSKLLAIQLFNELSGKYGGRQIEEHDIQRLSDLSIPDRLKALRIPLYKVPGMLLEGKREYRAAASGLQTAEGMREALVELKARGYRLGILSSNIKENILNFLDRSGLNIFDTVHSASNMFGKDKAIRSMARSMAVDPGQIVYIGDELRDVEACKKIGVRVIAVTWGFDSAKLLAEAGPDFLCHSAAELLDIIHRRLN